MVDQHQLALRSVILSVISDFSEEGISGSEGKDALSEKLLKEMNAKLESLKEFPGIEGVYFYKFCSTIGFLNVEYIKEIII